jgi:hypothetical protein
MSGYIEFVVNELETQGVGGVAEKERNKMWRVQNEDEKRMELEAA